MAVSVASSLLLLPLLQSSTYVPNKGSFVSFSIPAVAVGSLSLSRQRHVAIRAIEGENAGEVESEPSEVLMEIGDEPNVTVEKTPKKFNGANKKKIILKNKYGENIVGIFEESISDDIVILCHGFRSSKESKTISHLSGTLISQGISNFRFDFSGNGESEGKFEYGNYFKEVEDLRSVVQYFSEINREISTIIGHSKGGDVVILYASMYNDIFNVCNISGRFDLNQGIKERLGEDYMGKIRKNGYIDVRDKLGKFMYRVSESSLRDRLDINMEEKCVFIDRKIRVLSVHGSSDDVVPVNDAIEFDKVIKNHKLEIVEGADHRFSRNLFELSKIVGEFVRDRV